MDAVTPSRANIVDGMWILKVKCPPSSPPAFKARYVARVFSQRQGVDYFQNFSPTPKMTTLRVLLDVAAQHDYELHSLDLSTTFLQGSLHDEIRLHRPPGFTGSFRTFSSLQPTPLSTGHSLSAPSSDESVEPSGPYPELVGCLMYLMTCTRPDLAYPLSLLARYVAPGRHSKVHWDAAKRVLRYWCSTSGLGVVLGGRGPVVLTGHADASWVDDSATQRSSQGDTFSLVARHIPSSRAPCHALSCALPHRVPCPPVVRPALPSRASALPLPSRTRPVHQRRARAFCLRPSRAHDLPAAVTLPTAHSFLFRDRPPFPPFRDHLPLPSWSPNPSSPPLVPSLASFALPPPSPLITSTSYTPPPLFSLPYPSCSSSLPPPPSSLPLLQLVVVVACHLVIMLLSPHIPLLHPPPLISLPPLPSPSHLFLQLLSLPICCSCGAAADYSTVISPPLVSPLRGSAADHSSVIPPPLVSPLSGVAADYSTVIPPPLVSPPIGPAADYFTPIPPPHVSPTNGSAADYLVMV
ncbi:unnamed protein product [Closterium sp. NIES-54]